MVKIMVDIEGMACGMCEAHINEAVKYNAADVSLPFLTPVFGTGVCSGRRDKRFFDDMDLVGRNMRQK